MDKKRLQELAGVDLNEKFDDYDLDLLMHEIDSQYNNLLVYKPNRDNYEAELAKKGHAIIGSARDLIEATQKALEILDKSMS